MRRAITASAPHTAIEQIAIEKVLAGKGGGQLIIVLLQTRLPEKYGQLERTTKVDVYRWQEDEPGEE